MVAVYLLIVPEKVYADGSLRFTSWLSFYSLLLTPAKEMSQNTG
jgi:hypothetical protein